MKNVILLLTTFVFYFLFYTHTSQAEVWLANRFAQNCSSCHSPSRRNLEAKDRRCTLSCQGCHVNPNGGGMRSEYGVWNQQRWLRSFKSDFLLNKGTPAPLKFQKYANMPGTPPQDDATENDGSKTKSKGSKKDAKSKGKLSDKKNKNSKPSTQDKKRQPNAQPTYVKNNWIEMAEEGPALVVISGVEYDEEDHDRSDRQEHIIVSNRAEFMARVTSDDPYRIERERSIFGGLDFRYFYLDGEAKTNSATVSEFKGVRLPMALDFGLKWRPRPEHISLVLEHRSLNGPAPVESGGQSNLENIITGTYSGSFTRSAYVLVDDLPYATYVMYGMYRPMFGHVTPDHTSILNHLITADNRLLADGGDAYNAIRADSSRALNKALTIGGSPNVPFANVHYIMPVEDENYLPNYTLAREKGFAVNVGGRFVTWGASIMLSWWSTKGPRAIGGADFKTDMLGLSGGFTKNNFVFNADFTNLEREYAPGFSDKGSVTTFETKYRVWREIYLVANYAQSNVARNLKKGEATETMFGLKTFLYPGMEVEILSVARTDEDGESGEKTDTDLLQGQLHLFF